jgi:putative membrane protein
MVSWTSVFHVFGLVLWIGGLLTATLALSRHVQEVSPEARQALARLERLSLRAMADPGAMITIVAGIILISTNSSYYLHAAWLHIKLSFVVILIVLHVLVAIKTKQFAQGKATVTPGYVRLLLIAIVLVLISILIAVLPGQALLT